MEWLSKNLCGVKIGLKLYKVKCCVCGKEIFRKRTVIKNKFGEWKPKCNTCKRNESKEKALVRLTDKYKDDMEYRDKVLNRSKERYWKRRTPTSTLSNEDKNLLKQLNSYPVLGPGCLGTSEPTVNVKTIVVDGHERIKGAVYLEEYNKRKNVNK